MVSIHKQDTSEDSLKAISIASKRDDKVSLKAAKKVDQQSSKAATDNTESSLLTGSIGMDKNAELFVNIRERYKMAVTQNQMPNRRIRLHPE